MWFSRVLFFSPVQTVFLSTAFFLFFLSVCLFFIHSILQYPFCSSSFFCVCLCVRPNVCPSVRPFGCLSSLASCIGFLSAFHATPQHSPSAFPSTLSKLVFTPAAAALQLTDSFFHGKRTTLLSHGGNLTRDKRITLLRRIVMVDF